MTEPSFGILFYSLSIKFQFVKLNFLYSFVGSFLQTIQKWEMNLSNVSEVLDEWVSCQSLWLHLAVGVFSNSILSEQLPKEREIFDQVDQTYKKVILWKNYHCICLCLANLKKRKDGALLPHFHTSSFPTIQKWCDILKTFILEKNICRIPYLINFDQLVKFKVISLKIVKNGCICRLYARTQWESIFINELSYIDSKSRKMHILDCNVACLARILCFQRKTNQQFLLKFPLNFLTHPEEFKQNCKENVFLLS